MNEQQKRLVPKLRFPEFRGLQSWQPRKLSDACEVNPSSPVLPEQFVYIDLESVEAGKLITKKIVRKNEAPSRAQRVLHVGDVIFQMVRPYQRNNLFFEENDDSSYVASTGYAQLRAKESPEFLFQAIHVDDFVNRVIAKCTGSSYPAINSSDLAEMPLVVPSSDEQQKIADCLSSLDELIAAQARKVEALKTHKKGLMQQLLPREGETQPGLRFPEFQNAGEWVSEELSSCLKKVIDYRGIAPPKSQSGIPLITAKNVRFGWLDMTNDEYIEEDKYDEWMSRGIPHAADILFTTEAPLGNVALFPLSGKFALGQRLLTLRPKPERCDSAFLFQSLLGPTMQAEINFHGTGSTAKGIKSKVFVKLNFCHPNLQEQQRTAACLSTLDTLIAAANQELDTLKAHKKGLMQKLFPCLKKD